MTLVADPDDFICRPMRGLKRVSPSTRLLQRAGWVLRSMIVFGALISFVTRNLVAMFCFLAAAGTPFSFSSDAAVGRAHHFSAGRILGSSPAYIVARKLAGGLAHVHAGAGPAVAVRCCRRCCIRPQHCAPGSTREAAISRPSSRGTRPFRCTWTTTASTSAFLADLDTSLGETGSLSSTHMGWRFRMPCYPPRIPRSHRISATPHSAQLVLPLR